MISSREPEPAPDQGGNRARGQDEAPAANSQCERLRARVRQLEEELATVRNKLATVEDHMDGYRQYAQAYVRSQMTEEQWRSLTAPPEDESDCMTLDQFIGELEEVLRQAKRT